MIALRKDVKVGFVIGGIVLGVFGVYLGLSALAGEKPDNSMTGANLQLTPFGTQPTPTSVADRTSKSLTNPSNASKSQSQIKSGPAIANPSQPINVADSSGNDIWGNAFETGKLQPVVTVTPDANRLSAVTPRPADVISAINNPQGNNPQGNNSQPADGAKPDTRTGTASTADPSGSMVDLTSSSLTRASGTAGATQSHTIESGETLSSISATYYGDAKYFKLLIDANPQIDPNKLKLGTKISVPPLVKKEPRSDTTDVPAESMIDPAKQYVVKSGDSLSKIASSLYGDSNMWQKIYDANKPTIGDSPAKLKLGMVLNLPSPPTRK